MQPDMDDLCGEIRFHHRQRNYAMESRKALDLRVLGFLRSQRGWRKDGDAATNRIIAEEAKSLVDTAERLTADEKTQARQRIKPVITPEYEQWRTLIEGSVMARKPFDDIEAAATKEMERLASQLPAWTGWGIDIRGFSARGLAVIVGEAGNLSNYATHSKLWKRMGVAVMGQGDGLDDHRQGAPGTGASKDDWIAEGYSAKRRSRMFVIGDSFVKLGPSNTPSFYQELYRARKAYEIARAQELGLIVAPSAKIPAKRKAEFRSDGHIHRRAQRYMEKRLLRDLWRAWRVDGHHDLAARAAPHLTPSPANNHEPLMAFDAVPLAPVRVPDAARELSL